MVKDSLQESFVFFRSLRNFWVLLGLWVREVVLLEGLCEVSVLLEVHRRVG